jgi:hypothetical protein
LDVASYTKEEAIQRDMSTATFIISVRVPHSTKLIAQAAAAERGVTLNHWALKALRDSAMHQLQMPGDKERVGESREEIEARTRGARD